MTDYYGQLAAFGTVICWVICSIAFERAGIRIGSMAVNLIRLLFAFILISIYTYFSRGYLFPFDATEEAWFWLSLSGIVGFFIGDLCLFRAFITIGSRVSLLIYSVSPLVSAALGFIIFKETMTTYAILGMFVTLFGITLVILKKDSDRVKFSHPVQGVVMALLGALGQSVGVVLSKLGMRLDNGATYDAFSSTQIRIISSTLCFVLLYIILGRVSSLKKAITNKKAMGEIAVGSFFGPFIGVTLSLIAITYTTLGIASTITALLPVAIIVPHVLIYKDKVSVREITGAIISVIGVSLLFI